MQTMDESAAQLAQTILGGGAAPTARPAPATGTTTTAAGRPKDDTSTTAELLPEEQELQFVQKQIEEAIEAKFNDHAAYLKKMLPNAQSSATKAREAYDRKKKQ